MKLFSDCGCSLKYSGFGNESQVVRCVCEPIDDEVETIVAETCPLSLSIEIASLVEYLP